MEPAGNEPGSQPIWVKVREGVLFFVYPWKRVRSSTMPRYFSCPIDSVVDKKKSVLVGPRMTSYFCMHMYTSYGVYVSGSLPTSSCT